MYLSSCSVVQQVALVALWVFLHSYNDKKSINVYLVNLLTVDLLLTLALPFKVAKDLGVAPWGFMVFHCQVSAVVVYISMYVSIFFLTFVSVDCYMQIRYYYGFETVF